MRPVPVLLVATSLVLAAAAGPSRNPQCPGQIHPNCGLTDKAGIYHVSDSPGYQACCGMCAADPGNCTAWVFISHGPVFAKGPGSCKLRHTTATCRPDLKNHVSGDLTTPPAPPSPPPSPHPSPGPSPPTPPAAGRKPHIVLLVVDDWGFANVGYHRKGWSRDVRQLRHHLDRLSRPSEHHATPHAPPCAMFMFYVPPMLIGWCLGAWDPMLLPL